ncbi:MAG: HAD-IA family hydrolase [Chloroflexi bacterium]|nr:HAD-IA family hydrolase [Chloroflexota bacterium]
MTEQIEAILFDMGGTLRTSVKKSGAEKRELIQRMLDLLGAQDSVDEFTVLLSSRADAYKKWAEETLVELTESDLWTKWMLPDWPAEQISGMAIQLNQLYRAMTGTRTVFPETHDVVLELFRRGYRLGLVSNTTSSVEVPAALQELHVIGCFEAIILSTVVGKRKPDPSILLEATRRMGIAPEKCAYVGDRADRDVAAARRAGFSKAVILRDPRQAKLEREAGAHLTPDARITNLTGLLELFPPRPAPQPDTVYNASLSTMWALKNFPTLADFFEAARRMGFARIELNHKVTTAMLAGIDLNQYRFSSVHEPCPADIGEDELKKRDWLISSTDEACRVEGVKAIQRSIDMAKRVGAGTVVVHAGHSTPDRDKLEKKLREMIDAGQYDSNEYRAIQARMITIRAEFAAASFASVKKSVLELLAHAEPLGIRLGIENRYHYLEHASPDELQILLDLAGPQRIGFIFDIGHAETLDRLGFYPRDEWLRRFAPRILGTHLHDVITTTDHYAPGLGSVDFESAGGYLPAEAFRTCEFQNFNSPEQVKRGLDFLVEHGCIKKL